MNPLNGTTPAQRLSTEFGDFLGAMEFFEEVHPGVIDPKLVLEAKSVKKHKLLETNDPAHVERWKREIATGKPEPR